MNDNTLNQNKLIGSWEIPRNARFFFAWTQMPLKYIWLLALSLILLLSISSVSNAWINNLLHSFFENALVLWFIANYKLFVAINGFAFFSMASIVLCQFLKFYNYKEFAVAKLVHVNVNFREKKKKFVHFYNFVASDGITYRKTKSANRYFGELREIGDEIYMVMSDMYEKFIYPKNNPDEAIFLKQNSRLERFLSKYVP